MAVRAIRVRVNVNRADLERIWHTHKVFNERLPIILSVLFKMRRGECGENDHERNLYKLIAEFVLARNAKDAPYLLNSVSIKNWNPGTALKQKATIRDGNGNDVEVAGSVWAEEAAALSAQGKLLYDKHTALGDLPDTLRQGIVRQAVEILSGHAELVKRWEAEHAEWLERKAVWEQEDEHRKYLALRPMFESFEAEAGGKATKRRQRWHKYMTWLRQHPELAAWRGRDNDIHPISARGEARIKAAKLQKRNTVEAEEFWKANPELAALDRLHGEYEAEFVRRRKTKRNPDGFDHRPTFTLPHAQAHPRWFVFNAPQTSPQGYRNLLLPKTQRQMGSIELRLITDDADGHKAGESWMKVPFKADPRLSDFRPCVVGRVATKGAVKGQTKDRNEYVFLDRQLNIERPAQISGAKLMLKDIRINADGSLNSAVPYLVFTCNVESIPLSSTAKAIKWVESDGTTRTGKRRKKVTIPDGLVACSIDVGVRNLAFATIAEYRDGVPHVIRSRNLWVGHEETDGAHEGRWQRGPELAHVSSHKRQLRHLRSLRGKPTHGEESHIDLQAHITHMAEDRYKKGARAIINFAVNPAGEVSKRTGQPTPRADILIVEDLKFFNPDATREHGINRMLAAFNRGQLMQRLKEQCADVGLRFLAVNAYGTSQVCSRCGALGRRYSIEPLVPGGPSDIRFQTVGKLFACPACGYRANADHNASFNLHRRFSMGDEAIKALLELRRLPEREQTSAIEKIEQTLLSNLRQMHRFTCRGSRLRSEIS